MSDLNPNKSTHGIILHGAHGAEHCSSFFVRMEERVVLALCFSLRIVRDRRFRFQISFCAKNQFPKSEILAKQVTRNRALLTSICKRTVLQENLDYCISPVDRFYMQ